MLTGTQEGAQRNIFTTEQICQIELIKGRRGIGIIINNKYNDGVRKMDVHIIKIDNREDIILT